MEVGDRRIKMQIWDTVLLFEVVTRLDKKSSNQSLDHITAVLLQLFSCMTSQIVIPSTICKNGCSKLKIMLIKNLLSS